MASVVDTNVPVLASPVLRLQRLPHDAATATTAPYSPDVASLAVTDMHSETLEADSMKVRVQNLHVVRQSHRSAFSKLSFSTFFTITVLQWSHPGVSKSSHGRA